MRRQLRSAGLEFSGPQLSALAGALAAGRTLHTTLGGDTPVSVTGGRLVLPGPAAQAAPLDFEYPAHWQPRTPQPGDRVLLPGGTRKLSDLLGERRVPRAEKLAYVDRVVDLLELGDLQDAVVSSLGVEQRKRLTIGVELAARPSLLLFLDEPTSGLDSQSAYSIVRFLKKLSRAGQAIVCT